MASSGLFPRLSAWPAARRNTADLVAGVDVRIDATPNPPGRISLPMIVPTDGAKLLAGSSAVMRHSLQWPLILMSFWAR